MSPNRHTSYRRDHTRHSPMTPVTPTSSTSTTSSQSFRHGPRPQYSHQLPPLITSPTNTYPYAKPHTPVYTPRSSIINALSPPSSTPRPRSRAVLIGINYFGQKGEMRGRVDEARNLSNYLQQCKGYSPDDIVLLTDDQNGPFGQPNRRNIIAALQWLSEKAYPGEKVLLYYTGHGRINARGITEESRPGVIGSDSETIFPVDFRSKGEISPPELESRLREAQRKGVKLTLILDTHTAGFERPGSGSGSATGSADGKRRGSGSSSALSSPVGRHS